MNRRERIVQLIVAAAEELNETSSTPIEVERGDAAPLFGREGVLDSLGLVSLLAAVEEAIYDEFEIAVALADERAVSQQRSPFRTIGTLADYAASLIEHE